MKDEREPRLREAPSVRHDLADLCPELVPGMQVEEILAPVDELAVPDFEDDAAGDVEGLTVLLRRVLVDPDDGTVFVRHHLLQVGPEGAGGEATVLAEVTEDRVAALVAAAERAAPRR